MKNKKSNAVSEMLGTMLLLLIVISVFSLIYVQVLSDDGPENKTIVKIGGRIEGTNVVLEHQGGEPLELDTEISITVGGVEYLGSVGNWLDDKNDDGMWNVGESMLFSFEYNLSRIGDYQKVDITAIDTWSDSVIFMGPIDLKPMSDIGIELMVDNLYPETGEYINIIITVTCYGGDVDGAGNVKIRYLAPEGLVYYSSIAGQGTYDNETGIWDVGDVLVGEPASLRIEVQVTGIVIHEFTQLVMILDGSDSTNPDKWNTMKEGLKKAIKDETAFPYDGSVELTVIEYGGVPPRANAELLPTGITEDNYADIAQDLRNMAYPRGHAPMGCGLRLGADLVHDVGDFSSDMRQIIILVTDGKPDCLWIPGTYNATYENYTVGESSAEDAREYLNTTLNLQEDQDELNVIVVGNDVNIDWLNNSIAWPQPGYEAPPINGSGWVNHITGWQEFDVTINMVLKILFNSISIRVGLADSTTIDPYVENDNVVVLISPQT